MLDIETRRRLERWIYFSYATMLIALFTSSIGCVEVLKMSFTPGDVVVKVMLGLLFGLFLILDLAMMFVAIFKGEEVLELILDLIDGNEKIE